MMESEETFPNSLQTFADAHEVAGPPWGVHFLGIYSSPQRIGGCLKKKSYILLKLKK
jgi:hypothetical protein